MPKKTLVLLLVVGFAMAQARESLAQDVSWIKQFGTLGFDLAGDIATDSKDAYVTGRVGSNFALPGQVSAGGVDTFVRKYDAAGAEVWTRQIGTSRFDGISKIAVSKTSLYVAGITDGTFSGQSSAGGFDIFIRQYDTNGNAGWTRQLGTTGFDFVLKIAAHATGVYVFGFTSGAFPSQMSVGGSDFFLAKLDSAGTLLWVRQFGTSGNDPAVFSLGGVAVDDTGVYVGSTVPFALPGQTSIGDNDAFLRKYHHDGIELWTSQFGTACSEVLTGVAVHSNNVYVAGATTGKMTDPFSPRCTNPPIPNNNNGDVLTTFVQQWTAHGTMLWTQQYEGSSGNTGFSLAIGIAVNDTGLFVASEAIRPRNPEALDSACPVGNPAEDIHVRMYDLQGEELWTQQIGSTASDTPSGIALNATGVYVAGVTFCQLAGQISAGSADAVVIKLSPTP